MSVRVLHACFEGAKGVTGNDRAVLLVLADHASDDGSGAYPSHATIARKAGGIGERTVRDCLRRLQEGGWIDREGWSSKHTISYRVEIDPAAVAGFKLGSNPAAARQVREVEPGENASATRQRVADEPSIEPSTPEPTAQASLPYEVPSDLSSFIDMLNRVVVCKGGKSLHVRAAVKACRDFADRDLASAADKFEHYWTDGAGQNRKLRDIAGAWRNWLRNDPPATATRSRPRKHSRVDELVARGMAA